MQKILFLLASVFLLFNPFQARAQSGFQELSIILREEWKNEAPKMESKNHGRSYVTIPHTNARKNAETPTEGNLIALQNFSFTEGFPGDGTHEKPLSDLPYYPHAASDGTIAIGREIKNFEKSVSALAEKRHISPEFISGHQDQAPTACPGINLYKLLAQVREKQKLASPSRVKIGAEQLFSPEFEDLIKGKRVGLVTNHTGVLPNGKHLIDVLNDHRNVSLSLLFGPEHGLRGEEDTQVANGTDKATGVPIISLYGEVRKPTKEMLNKVDILIFDIQDIGARFYTYIKTMLRVQEAAAEHGIPFVVLDRPNPITGNYVDGPLGKALEPVTGIGNIPITHGMTVGELALMFNGERKEKHLPVADLTVIPMKNYKRDQWYDQTGLPWIKPSPNMLTLNTAIVYPATCLLEGTNYSEARGTLMPFELFGAPWIDGKKVAEKLNSHELAGVTFRSTSFVPDSIVDGIKIYPPKFLGEKCEGVEIVITDRDQFKSAEAGIYILYTLRELYPVEFEWRKGRIDGLLGTPDVREQLQAGNSPQEIVGKWQDDINRFEEKRKIYLLY